MHADNQLPPEVQDALNRNQTIEAIKLLRQATGLGLKEAKNAIDAHMNNAPYVPPVRGLIAGLPEDVQAALRQGNKIEAIRLLREHTGQGLKDAKDAVDTFQPTTPASGNLAPGEVPPSNAWVGWIALAAVIGLIAYFLLRSAG